MKNPMRSDSSHNIFSRAFLGNTSKYVVISRAVNPLFSPPAPSMILSNLPGSAFSEPPKRRCSKRWANPVLPGISLLEPTWYIIAYDIIGSEWSVWRITCNPFGITYLSYEMLSLSFSGAFLHAEMTTIMAMTSKSLSKILDLFMVRFLLNKLNIGFWLTNVLNNCLDHYQWRTKIFHLPGMFSNWRFEFRQFFLNLQVETTYKN